MWATMKANGIGYDFGVMTSAKLRASWHASEAGFFKLLNRAI